VTIRKERPNRQKKIQAQSPLAEGLPAVQSNADPEHDDIFDPLLSFVSNSNENNAPEAPPTTLPPNESLFSRKHLLSLQGILLAGIICLAGILVHTVLEKIKARPMIAPAMVPAGRSAPQPRPADVATRNPPAEEKEPSVYESPEPTAPQSEPLSLQVAQKHYLDGDYDNAFIAYDRLYRLLAATEQNQPVKDFLLLRMALCSRTGGDVERADTMFRTVALSRLPILRAIARYYQSITLLDRQQSEARRCVRQLP
jgi:hypothetical protein